MWFTRYAQQVACCTKEESIHQVCSHFSHFSHFNQKIGLNGPYKEAIEGFRRFLKGLKGLENEPVEAALEHGHEASEGKAHPQHLALIAARS